MKFKENWRKSRQEALKADSLKREIYAPCPYCGQIALVSDVSIYNVQQIHCFACHKDIPSHIHLC